MNPVERSIKALKRAVCDEKLTEERLIELFLDTRSDEELDILYHLARDYTGETYANAEIFSAMEAQVASITALTIEDLKKLDQIDRSTKGFVDIGQKEAEWLISLGFKRKLWVVEPSKDSCTWLPEGLIS